MNAKFPISRKQESCSYKLSSFPQILIESVKYFPRVTGHPVYIDSHYEADQSTLDSPSPLCSSPRKTVAKERSLL